MIKEAEQQILTSSSHEQSRTDFTVRLLSTYFRENNCSKVSIALKTAVCVDKEETGQQKLSDFVLNQSPFFLSYIERDYNYWKS